MDDGLSYWDNPNASSSAYRTESFSFDGPGVLTVTVPYTMSISGGERYNYYDSTSASINASASFYGYEDGGDFSSHSNASFHLSSFYDSAEQSQSGNLVFGIFAAGPGDGTLRIGMNTSAGGFVSGIPEPETYAMLLAGLGLMGALSAAGAGTEAHKLSGKGTAPCAQDTSRHARLPMAFFGHGHFSVYSLLT